MVRRFIILENCDWCALYEIRDVPAVAKYIITVNGGPEREVLLCQRCDLAFRPFVEVYAVAVDLNSEKAVQAPRPNGKKRLAKKQPAKELEAAPSEELPPETKQPEPEKKKKEKKPAAPKLRIICTESHASENGGPKEISYQDRSSHVGECHPGKRIWDVAWGYPTDREWFPCTAHAECMKTTPPLSFISVKAVVTHARACLLPRIDIDINPSQEVP